MPSLGRATPWLFQGLLLRWAPAVCLILIGLSFCGFGFSLDRYPLPYVDDPFFNYPAIRYLAGEPFAYPYSAEAPYGNMLWAYHGPFFPILQIQTFRAFGASEVTCRIPQYLCAHLAILVLCLTLLVSGLRWSALLLSMAWLGDRSYQEVLYGRMEGINLFLLAVGFALILGIMRRPTLVRGVLLGFCLGTSVGFNPVTAVFAPVAVGLLGWVLPRPDVQRVLSGIAAGTLLPAGLALGWFGADISHGVEQFRWHAHQVGSGGLTSEVLLLIRTLRWSRYWLLALSFVTVTLSVPLAFRRLARGPGAEDRHVSRIGTVATGFALAGFICLLTASVRPYYLVCFTVWPVMALAADWESGSIPRRFVPWFVLCSAAVAASWIPSLAWNAMRFREAVLAFRALDRAEAGHRLARAVPRGAKVTGTPELLFLARQAGLDFTPLPWLPSGETPVPPETWILLTQYEWKETARSALMNLDARPVVFQGNAFPKAKFLGYPIVLFGPQPTYLRSPEYLRGQVRKREKIGLRSPWLASPEFGRPAETSWDNGGMDYRELADFADTTDGRPP